MYFAFGTQYLFNSDWYLIIDTNFLIIGTQFTSISARCKLELNGTQRRVQI